MTVYLDRSAWTSTAASGATLTGAELVGVAWHWPGTTQKVIGVQTQAATAQRLRDYRNFHVTGRGWRDIGYNVAFDQAGRVWLLRSTTWGVNLVGAHAASDDNPRANHKYVGCLLILGADEHPSAAMLEAINDWYWTRFLPRWPGRTDNRGHGQVPGASTSCQGSAVKAALAARTIPGPKSGSTEEDDVELKDNLPALKRPDTGALQVHQVEDALNAAIWIYYHFAGTQPYTSAGVRNWAKAHGMADIKPRIIWEYLLLNTSPGSAEFPGSLMKAINDQMLALKQDLLAAIAGLPAQNLEAVQAAAHAGAEDALEEGIDLRISVRDEDSPPGEGRPV